MAYEAMNNANYLEARMITILNDNGQVSLPTGQPSAGGIVPVGALSATTSKMLSSSEFKDFRCVWNFRWDSAAPSPPTFSISFRRQTPPTIRSPPTTQ